MIYGYIRVSTPSQDPERQRRNILREYPDAKIYEEKMSGKTMLRPEWIKLVKRVKKGDTIVFDSVSRMSRDASEGIETYFDLYEKGIILRFLKEANVNTESYDRAMAEAGIRIEAGEGAEGELIKGIVVALNRYMRARVQSDICAAFEASEREVREISERTKEGIETARLNGKQIGAPKGSKFVIKKKAPAKKRILELSHTFGGPLQDNDAYKVIGINRNTYFKYKRELIQELREQQEKESIFAVEGNFVE